MTGFGQGEVSSRHSRVSVEIRTVNHRFLDYSIKVPKALSSREHEIKTLLRDKISRGRISVTITVEMTQPKYNVSINVPLMEQYMNQLRQFSIKHSLSTEVDINSLASLPEVFDLKENQDDPEELWPLARRGLKQALNACVKMRQDEGKALETDIRARIQAITRNVRKVEKLAPKVMTRHTASFKNRLGKMMEGSRVDNDRWMTEVAILADRLDFTEEIIRLKSHLAQLKACLEEGGAVAKRLTYLLQEVHREATTIGSKASDAEIVERVVSLKEESEKFREQVQNIE
jgi:uncharacterized protein (TIGR00255 family)